MNEYTAIFMAPALTEAFELTLARAVDRIKNGDNIIIVFCDGEISGCVANPFRLNSICQQCNNVRNIAFKENFKDQKLVPLSEMLVNYSVKHSVKDILPEISSAIRKGAISTILTFYRVDIQKKFNFLDIRGHAYRLMAKNYMQHSEYVFLSISALFAKYKNIDRIEFFNGRIVPAMAALMSAKSNDVAHTVIEVMGKEKSMFLCFDSSVHDLNYMKKRLTQYLSSNIVDGVLGEKFFIDRRAGLATDHPSFVAKQKPGNLSVNKGIRIVSFFLSSPDELRVSGDQWFTDGSLDPVNFIKRLRQLISHQDYRFIVRMHPNQHDDRTGESGEIMKSLSNINGVELITPHDKVSTYELIDNSDYVITFGSTVGLEATYWGKVSILAGRALWEDSGVVYKCDSCGEVYKLINENPAPLSATNAIGIGSFFMDEHDFSHSLSWGKGGFFVNGNNYLHYKRKGYVNFVIFMNKVVDKFLRHKII